MKTKTQTAEMQTARSREIAAILLKYHAERGISPEKLRLILQDLGPTFIKLGQIFSTRTDVLPAAYCEELAKLRADVDPMPFDVVKKAVEDALGKPITEAFAEFQEKPLGAASIAQAHLAKLPDGQQVVVKVQRPGIGATMGEDIALLRKGAGVMRLTGLDQTVDLNMVLDEMWATAQEEMDFRQEARNLAEFADKNGNIRCIACPKVYPELCCQTLLTMEYIAGYSLLDQQTLVQEGYDLKDIGDKLADNYVKQIVQDGFFHADPHPGNIRIREGQIIWLDMGMMGRITERDRKLMREAITAVSSHDVESLRRIVMAMGRITGPVDSMQLTSDIDDFLSKYESIELGGLDVGKMLEELMDMAKRNHIAMPAGMTMLARGCMTIEGVLLQLSPETSIMAIVTRRVAQQRWDDLDLKRNAMDFASDLHGSFKKAARLPSQVSDLLRTANKGEAKVNIEVRAKEGLALSERQLTKAIRALLAAALLLGGCVVCLAKGLPSWAGIPVPAWIAFALGLGLGCSACLPQQEKPSRRRKN